MIILMKPFLYVPWLIFCLIFLFFTYYLSFKFIPTKKENEILQELSKEYKIVLKKDYDVKTKANLLEFTCPSCEHLTNFLEFIEQKACPKCDSKLWTTRIMDKGPEYYDIFMETEKIERFLSKLSFRRKSRLKKMIVGI